jgi:hypothetical protein
MKGKSQAAGLLLELLSIILQASKFILEFFGLSLVPVPLLAQPVAIVGGAIFKSLHNLLDRVVCRGGRGFCQLV